MANQCTKFEVSTFSLIP